MQNELGNSNWKYYIFWLKINIRRLDILLQIKLIDNKAAILTTLHLWFNMNPITHFFQKATVTYCSLMTYWSLSAALSEKSFKALFFIFNIYFKYFIVWFLFVREHLFINSLTRTHPPVHLQVKGEDEKVWKAFPSQKCQVELFFWVVEVWHLFGAAAAVGQKFLQMLAESGEKCK